MFAFEAVIDEQLTPAAAQTTRRKLETILKAACDSSTQRSTEGASIVRFHKSGIVKYTIV
jgi:hypothetical protein